MAWLPRNEFCSPLLTSTISKKPTTLSSTKKKKEKNSKTKKSTIASSSIPSIVNESPTTASSSINGLLPSLWDTTCGDLIHDSSFSQKRLFADPKRKLLLPIFREEKPKKDRGDRRQSKSTKVIEETRKLSRMWNADGELDSIFDGDQDDDGRSEKSSISAASEAMKKTKRNFLLPNDIASPLGKILEMAKADVPITPTPGRHRTQLRFNDDNNSKITPNIARVRIALALHKE